MPDSHQIAAPDDKRIEKKLAISSHPYLTLKAAVTLDGKIATRQGESQWITGEAARSWAHRLRVAHDAVLVGRETVAADDPQLTVRGVETTPGESPGEDAVTTGKIQQPARVVLDSRCVTSPNARCFNNDGSRRIVVTGNTAPEPAMEQLRTLGVEIVQCSQARPEPGEFLPILREMGLQSILVEGGGEVHAGLIAHGPPDELFLIMAGMVFGGNDAPGWVASLGVDRLAQAPRLALRSSFFVGEDLVVHGVFT